MSSFGTKNHVHHHPQLRRQKTCFEVGSTNKLRDNSITTTTGMTASTKRGFCLQRQLSVDATSVIVSPAKFVSAFEKNTLAASNSSQDLTWKCGSNTSVNEHHHSSPKSSAAVPIIKKRSTQPTSNSNGKTTEQETPDRHKKALKDRGNRLNLNIFLSHSTNSQDGDINGSDAESSNESMTLVNKENTNMAKTDVQSNCNKSSESNNNNNNNNNSNSNSNDSDNSNNNNNNNQVPVKKVPDTNATGAKPTNSRRPPLVRAMSAPIRPKNDDSSTADSKMIQVKRKLKKKKNLAARDSGDDILEEKFDEPDIDFDDISNSSDSASNLVLPQSTTTNISSTTSNASNNPNINEIKKQIKPVKKATLQRPRSAAVGNEVVTLVSLLSSGGSDSEREDNHTALPASNSATTTGNPYKTDVMDFNVRQRAPMLRKSGKSVSFQERDLLPEIPSSTKDFSKYRRGSVAPIAARLRSNRPPTAPAGSIYLCDIDINNDDFMKSIKTSLDADNANNNNNNNNNTWNENKRAAVESKATVAYEVEEIEISYPENVRTPKERECWKLYQKMLNRGVTVSYDTILRGMLTPTELRIIQKQNETRRFFDTEPSACDGSGSSTPSSTENPIRDGNVNCL